MSEQRKEIVLEDPTTVAELIELLKSLPQGYIVTFGSHYDPRDMLEIDDKEEEVLFLGSV